MPRLSICNYRSLRIEIPYLSLLHRLVLESNFRSLRGVSENSSNKKKTISLNNVKMGTKELFMNIYSMRHEHH